MTRIKGGPYGHLRHKKILKITKGQRGAKHFLFKRANEAIGRVKEMGLFPTKIAEAEKVQEKPSAKKKEKSDAPTEAEVGAEAKE